MKKVLGTSPTPNNLRKQLSLGGARAKSHTENFFPLVTPPWHLPVPEGPGSHSWAECSVRTFRLLWCCPTPMPPDKVRENPSEGLQCVLWSLGARTPTSDSEKAEPEGGGPARASPVDGERAGGRRPPGGRPVPRAV